MSVKQCRDCDLIFSDPQPIPENLSDHYDLPPEEYWKGLPAWSQDYFARARQKLKRGGGIVHVSLDDAPPVPYEADAELIALDDALQTLATFDQRKSRVIELRFFGGLSVEETAEALDVSPITVMRDWGLAKAWLLRELDRRHDA